MSATRTVLGVRTNPDGTRVRIIMWEHPSGYVRFTQEPLETPRINVRWWRVLAGVALIWFGVAWGWESAHLSGANLIGAPLTVLAGGVLVVLEAVRAGVRW